jgi:hypothetical protein
MHCLRKARKLFLTQSPTDRHSHLDVPRSPGTCKKQYHSAVELLPEAFIMQVASLNVCIGTLMGLAISTYSFRNVA